jgi:hypothetical protein
MVRQEQRRFVHDFTYGSRQAHRRGAARCRKISMVSTGGIIGVSSIYGWKLNRHRFLRFLPLENEITPISSPYETATIAYVNLKAFMQRKIL